MGQRLLRKRQVAPAQDAGAPVGKYDLRGRGDGADARTARTPPRGRGRVARTRRTRKANRQTGGRGGGVAPGRERGSCPARGPLHPSSGVRMAHAVSAGEVLLLAARGGPARPRAERRGGGGPDVGARTQQPVREPGPRGGNPRRQTGLRDGREDGAAAAREPVPATENRHHHRAVRGRGEAGFDPRWGASAYDPRAGRSAAVRPRSAGQIRHHHGTRRSPADAVLEPRPARRRRAVRALGRHTRPPVAERPLSDRGATLGRRSGGRHAPCPPSQEGERAAGHPRHARGERRRGVAASPGHQTGGPPRGPAP